MTIDVHKMTIAERAYLLQCDPRSGKLTDRNMVTPRLIRAAVLADLAMQGAIKDRNGKVELIPDGVPANEVSAFVLARMYASNARTWKEWIQRDQRETMDRLEDQLQLAGILTVKSGKFLWIFPTRDVQFHDLQRIDAVRVDVRTVALGDEPVAEIAPGRAALAALAVSAENRRIISYSEVKRASGRIAEILDEAGPIGPALRKAITETQASIAIGAGAATIATTTTS